MTVEQNEQDIQKLRSQLARLLDILFGDLPEKGSVFDQTQIRELKDELENDGQ